MHVIDIIILVLIGIGVIQGLMKGSIKQLAQIVGFVAGLLLARGLFSTVAEQLAPALGTSITIAQILSFILIWVAVPIGCSLIASVLTKALDVIIHKAGDYKDFYDKAIGEIEKQRYSRRK